MPKKKDNLVYRYALQLKLKDIRKEYVDVCFQQNYPQVQIDNFINDKKNYKAMTQWYNSTYDSNVKSEHNCYCMKRAELYVNAMNVANIISLSLGFDKETTRNFAQAVDQDMSINSHFSILRPSEDGHVERITDERDKPDSINQSGRQL